MQPPQNHLQSLPTHFPVDVEMAAEGRRDAQLVVLVDGTQVDFRRHLQGQQDLLRQAVRNINTCVDENERLVAENERLEAEIARLRYEPPHQVTPSVVWPNASCLLTFEQLCSWARTLGTALRLFTANTHRWGGFPDNRANPYFVQHLTAQQRHAIGEAMFDGWIGDR